MQKVNSSHCSGRGVLIRNLIYCSLLPPAAVLSSPTLHYLSFFFFPSHPKTMMGGLLCFPGLDCAHFQHSIYSWPDYIHLSLRQHHNVMKSLFYLAFISHQPPSSSAIIQTKQTQLYGTHLQGGKECH